MQWRALSSERCWAIGVLAIMGLHSMVEFPLWHADFLGAFALLFGLASPAFAAVEASRLRRGGFLIVFVSGWLTGRSNLSDYPEFEAGGLNLEETGKRGETFDWRGVKKP